MPEFEQRNPFARLGWGPGSNQRSAEDPNRFGTANVSELETNSSESKKKVLAPLTDAERAIGTPFSTQELFDTFSGGGSFAKHLLTLYSLAVGVNAKVIADIGIGSTTRALLKAVEETKGRVYSCDFDRRRYSRLFEIYPKTKRWRLSLIKSLEFIEALPDGIDFVCHDGAHDAETVKADLEALIPKVKQFGIIVVHDTQHVDFRDDLTAVVRDLSERFPLTTVTLPYSCGLTIIRVERSNCGAITQTGPIKRGRILTEPAPLA